MAVELVYPSCRVPKIPPEKSVTENQSVVYNTPEMWVKGA